MLALQDNRCGESVLFRKSVMISTACGAGLPSLRPRLRCRLLTGRFGAGLECLSCLAACRPMLLLDRGSWDVACTKQLGHVFGDNEVYELGCIGARVNELGRQHPL